MNTVDEGIAKSHGSGGVAEQMHGYWWLFVLTGIIALAVGIIAISFPDRTLLVLALVFGIYLLFWGVVQIVMAVGVRDEDLGRMLLLLLGVAGIIAGLIIIAHPERSILILTLVIGIFLVFSGILEFGAALGEQSIMSPNLYRGMVSVAVGVLLLAWPGPSLLILALIIGIGFIIRGIIDMIAGFGMLRHRKG